MGAKAVYNDGVLAIYVTREELQVMLGTLTIDIPLYVGKTKLVKRGCIARLTDQGLATLVPYVEAERRAYGRSPATGEKLRQIKVPKKKGVRHAAKH